MNPNPDMVEEFKVLQANFGAENAKGPTTINVVSKAGGREFRGTAYTYLRHYSMNANEWFLNKVDDSASGPQNQPKNKFYFPGFNLGGPLLIPGTNFNKNRDKLFFFFGYEYLQAGPRHRHAAVVGTDAGDAERRLLGHGVYEPARRRRREKSAVVRQPTFRPARSIRTGRFC